MSKKTAKRWKLKKIGKNGNGGKKRKTVITKSGRKKRYVNKPSRGRRY